MVLLPVYKLTESLDLFRTAFVNFDRLNKENNQITKEGLDERIRIINLGNEIPRIKKEKIKNEKRSSKLIQKGRKLGLLNDYQTKWEECFRIFIEKRDILMDKINEYRASIHSLGVERIEYDFVDANFGFKMIVDAGLTIKLGKIASELKQLWNEKKHKEFKELVLKICSDFLESLQIELFQKEQLLEIGKEEIINRRERILAFKPDTEGTKDIEFELKDLTKPPGYEHLTIRLKRISSLLGRKFDERVETKEKPKDGYLVKNENEENLVIE